MKVKILVNDVEREVTFKGIRERHREDFFKKIGALGKIKGGISQIDAMGDFQEYWNDLIKEFSDLTEEEYANLELEEKNKLIVALRNVFLPFGNEKDF